MHFRFDLLFEDDLAALDNFLNMRPQVTRIRIDERKFLFNTEVECVLFRPHRGLEISFKKYGLSSSATRRQAFCRPGWKLTFPDRSAADLPLRLAGIFPSSGCLGPERARGLCESPSPKLLRPPTRNSAARSRRLRNPAQGYKSRSPPGRHRELRTRRYSGRSREIDSSAKRLPRRFVKCLSARATRSGNANEKDAAVHRA